MRRTALLAVALWAMASGSALASGPVAPPPPYIAPVVPTTFDWSGGYIGLRLGAPLGENTWAERSIGAESTPDRWSGTLWGLSAGYDRQSGSMVYGAALDYTGGEIVGASTTSASFGCAGACETHVENTLAIRGRVGRAFDRTLVYATAGFATGNATARNPGGLPLGSDRLNGWTAGLGVEHALSDRFSINLEYLFTDLGRLEIPASCTVNCYSDVSFGTIRLGANFRF
ncbi:MAG: porin family protein [Rhodobacteraceae bacterium]|nr:porin family protein [Paracoccaceae bacterium]